MIGTIYALASPDGEPRYCGKTIKPPSHRLHGHKDSAYRNRARHVNNWLRSVYDASQEPKLMICETLDLTGMDRIEQIAKLNEAERRWIAQLRALGFRLTNATSGGDGAHGTKLSPERIAKMVESNRARLRSPEQRARLIEMRKNQINKSGPDNPRYGKPQVWRDPAARVAKILATKAEWSGEQQEKATAHLRNNRHAKRKLSPAQVEEIRTSKLSQSKLAKAHGVAQSTISFIKAGKRHPVQESI